MTKKLHDPNYDTWEEKRMDLVPRERLMNLDEFIHQDRYRNTYISEPGFLSLYVRKNLKRYIMGRFVDDVLDIANIEAAYPGQGNFTALINRIQEKYPEYTIYIENVMNSRFVEKLDKMGFIIITPISSAPCFYFPGLNYYEDRKWPEGKINNPAGRHGMKHEPPK